MLKRFAGHHKRAEGFGSPRLDKYTTGTGLEGYSAIWGREQQLIDSYGGVGNHRVGNSIRSVSPLNPAGHYLWDKSNEYFGPLAPYTGVW
jgi:hypothetical protein